MRRDDNRRLAGRHEISFAWRVVARTAGRVLAVVAFGFAALMVTPVHATQADSPLRPFVGEYELLRDGDVIGRATITLRFLVGEAWELVTDSEATGGLAGLAGAHIVERSAFRWRDGRPELISYRYEQKVAWKERRRSLDTDMANGLVRADDGKQKVTLPFEAGLQDRHTVVLALAADLLHGDRALTYRVADKLKIGEQDYRRAGSETVAVPAGEFATERLERLRENKERTTTSWLARELNYMPVRIVQREPDGETMEMRLLKR